MSKYSDKTVTPLFVDAADGLSAIKFCVANFGEDVGKVTAAFLKEHGHNYITIPVVVVNGVPRKEFCTRQSLAAAAKARR